MTVIAWDGCTLAADRLAAYGSLRLECTKILRHGDQLIGVSGEAGLGEEMVAWYVAGAEKHDFPPAQRNKDDWQPMIVIDVNRPGIVKMFNRSPYPAIYEQKTFAIGCGREIAMTAMRLGKTAREAVELACEMDPNCGGGVDVLEARA